ncbi:LysR family transcriptional regulator [Paraburkholderia sp. EG287B]|uniref:LysR family transcriptional regulator n=1 Tax=Paraburkholderia sp. EG287B TaxID=3237010 RepID=UPI0034D2C7FF
MDTLSNMRMFVRVVEAGSFTAAANSVDKSTGQASRAVTELEAHLQTRLLNRSTRHVGVTEAGQRYLQHCYRILAFVDQAEAEASNAHLQPSGRLRVHATASFGQHYVMPAVLRYQALFPQVSVELTLSQHVPDLIEEGYDVSVQLGAIELPDSGLVSVPVAKTCNILCASPSYLTRHGTPATVADLAAHTCMRTSSPVFPQSRWNLDGPHGTETFELPPSPFQVNVAEAMALALRDGRGIGALPLWTAMPWLRNGTLLRVLPTHRMNETHIRALYVSREYLDAKIRSWVDFLRDFIPQTLDDGDNVPPAAVLTDADLTM